MPCITAQIYFLSKLCLLTIIVLQTEPPSSFSLFDKGLFVKHEPLLGEWVNVTYIGLVFLVCARAVMAYNDIPEWANQHAIQLLNLFLNAMMLGLEILQTIQTKAEPVSLFELVLMVTMVLAYLLGNVELYLTILFAPMLERCLLFQMEQIAHEKYFTLAFFYGLVLFIAKQ